MTKANGRAKNAIKINVATYAVSGRKATFRIGKMHIQFSTRSVPSANAGGKAEKWKSGKSKKCSANFHVQGDKTKRNKTRRTDTRAKSFSSSFGLVSVLLLPLLLFLPVFLACCSLNLAISCYICHRQEGKSGKDHRKSKHFPQQWLPFAISAHCHPHWLRPKKRRAQRRRMQNLALGLGPAPLTHFASQPAFCLWPDSIYVHLHDAI